MSAEIKAKVYHTHNELKDLLIHYYSDSIENGFDPNIHAMRLRGLTGGRLELVKAWDALAEEGKIPHREKRKFKEKNPRPRPEKEKPSVPIGFTTQCILMYGRNRKTREHKVIASCLKTRKPLSKIDIAQERMNRCLNRQQEQKRLRSCSALTASQRNSGKKK